MIFLRIINQKINDLNIKDLYDKTYWDSLFEL